MARALVRGRLATRVERSNHDGVADGEAVDARAELGDRARHLVSDHLRYAHAVIHVAVGDVDVGAADTAEGDVEPHLARVGRLDLALADAEAPGPFVVDGRHCVSASSASSMCLSHCSPSTRWIRSAALALSASCFRSAS